MTDSSVSGLCPEDNHWYQACGMNIIPIFMQNQLCGSFFCQQEDNGQFHLTSSVTIKNMCTSTAPVCLNIIPYSEQYDLLCQNEWDNQKCYEISGDIYQVLDSSPIDCDSKCDCPLCEDEFGCEDHTQGMICKDSLGTLIYLSYRSICNSVSECADSSDEDSCEEGKVGECIGKDTSDNPITVTLNNKNTCQIPNPDTPLCYDSSMSASYVDQMNCSDSLVHCQVDSYPTTVTSHLLCRDKEVCDDGIDSLCEVLEDNCKVHKHQRCDGAMDCEGGEDENPRLCR